MYSKEIAEKYPDILLTDRAYYESLLLFCCLEDTTILTEYGIKKSYFLNEEYYILADAIINLSKTGYITASQLEVNGCIGDSKLIKKISESNFWERAISHKNMANPDNIKAYVDGLLKSVIYFKLYDMGIDVTTSTRYQKGEKKSLFEIFKSLSSNDVKDFYEDEFNSFQTLDLSSNIDEGFIDFGDDYILQIENGELEGTPFDCAGMDVYGKPIITFPTLSEETGGLIEGSFSMLAGYSNVGKSTWLITLIMSLVYRGEKVVICSNEQTIKPFKDNFLLWILCNKLKYYKIGKKELRKGRKAINKEGIEKIKEAQEIWKREYYGKIKFFSVPSASLDEVLKKYKEYYLKEQFSVFIYDTFKADFSSGNELYWLQLIKDSRRLQEFANKYKVKAFATMQCSLSTEGQLFLDASVLSQSKQVKEILENLYIMRTLYEEEKIPDNVFNCRPYKESVSTKNEFGIKMSTKEDIELSINKDYRVLFLDKLRAGRTSKDGNYALVLEFDGARSIVREVGKCKPKRRNINAHQRNN